MDNSIHLNSFILDSIPVKRSFKNFWIKKYKRLVENNGYAFAESYFSNLRQLVLHYLEEGDFSPSSVTTFLMKQGLTGRLRMTKLLLVKSQSQPYDILNLLKLPTGANAPSVTKAEAYEDFIKELDGQPDTDFYPSSDYELARTVDLLVNDKSLISTYLRSYWTSSQSRLTTAHDLWKQALRMEADLYPMPFMYKDATKQPNGAWVSASYEKDVSEWKPSMVTSSELPVGQINLVNKVGSNEFRPVASPNRYVQWQLAESYTWLTNYISGLPADATFDQNKFNSVIQTWVDDPNLHPYGVDIHHATNWIPFRASELALDLAVEMDSKRMDVSLPSKIKQLANRNTSFRRIVARDRKYMRNVSKAPWKIPSYRDGMPVAAVRFKVGQPLGVINSFRYLSLANLLYATTAVRLWLTSELAKVPSERRWERFSSLISADHTAGRQFYILGDDIVFKDERVAAQYIKLMQDDHVPLSLHKSYHGSLVEFAGKTFIAGKGHPRYTTDHKIITWNNLFDYQQATETFIPYPHLPKTLRSKWDKRVRHMIGDAVSPGSLYNAVAKYISGSRKTTRGELNRLTKFFELSAIAQEEPSNDINHVPDVFLYSGPNGLQVLNSPSYDLLGVSTDRPDPGRERIPKWMKTKRQIWNTDVILDRICLSISKQS